MRGASGRLFLAEMTKVWRTRFPYFGLVASALTAFIARQNALAAAPGEMTSAAFLSISMNLCSTLVAPIFGVIFAATLVASETSRGTHRMILPRPIRRTAFLNAKLMMGLFYLLLLFLAHLAVAVPLAMRYPLRAAFDEFAPVPGGAEQLGILLVALGLTLLPHITTICFGFLVSVLSSNVATAIGVAVGVLLSLLPVSVFIRIGDVQLSDWIFSSHYDTAIGIASEKAQLISGATWQQDKVYLLLTTSGISTLVFLAISYWYFTRRDLNF